MTTQHPSSDSHTRLSNFRPEDVKKLVQLEGKAKEGDMEFILKDPSPTDPHLKAIINDPNFEVRSIGNQTKSGEMYYDLRATGKQLRIRVICQKLK